MNFSMMKKSNFLLIILGFILLSILFYQETIFYPPSFIHEWTQADHLALSIHFQKNGYNIFLPETYNLQSLNGITGVDLPLMDWIVAVISNILGSDLSLTFRLTVLGFNFIGYYFLYRWSKAFIEDELLAVFLTVFVFTIPILVYYQAGMIPSMTSFPLLLMANYAYHKNKVNYFLVCLTLAVLVRSTFGIFWITFLIISTQNLFKNKNVLKWSISLMFIVSYQVYKHYLNEIYGSQFLTTILPARDWDNFVWAITTTLRNWKFQLFTIGHYLMIFVIVWLGSKRFRFDIRNNYLQIITISLLGCTCFFFLMLRQFPHHEYYFIDTFYYPLILIIAVFLQSAKEFLLRNKRLTIIGGVILLVLGTFQSFQIQKDKYADGDRNNAEKVRKAFLEADKLLDSLGIRRDAKLLVLEPFNTNTPLISADRKGWTCLKSLPKEFDEYLQKDFNYILAADFLVPSEILSIDERMFKRLKRIGGNGKISVFELDTEEKNKKIKELLDFSGEVISFNIVPNEIDSVKLGSLSKIPKMYDENSNSFFRTEEDELYPLTYELDNPFERYKFKKILLETTIKSKEDISDLAWVANVLNEENEHLYYVQYTIKQTLKNNYFNYQCMFLLPKNIENPSLLKIYLVNQQKISVDIQKVKITFLN